MVNTASTISALVLSATLGLLLSPPDIVFEDAEKLEAAGIAWVPYVYSYSITVTVGAGIAIILVAWHFQLVVSFSVRDADWLRVIFDKGDSFTVILVCVFVFSFIAPLPAMVSIWASTSVGPFNSSLSLGMIAIFIGPAVVLLACAQIMMAINGSIDAYWLKRGLSIRTGMMWEKFGSEKPQTGTEISNAALATALLKGKLDFTREEFDKFKVSTGELSSDSYIKAGDKYFKPIVRTIGELDDRPDFDYLIGEFEEKIICAQKLVKANTESRTERQKTRNART